MNPDNPDDPGTSILLDAQTAGQSGFYGGADPNVVVTDREFTMLTLNYTPSGPGDPAIGRRVTVTFRTEWGSQGPTFWDNATLEGRQQNRRVQVRFLVNKALADASFSGHQEESF